MIAVSHLNPSGSPKVLMFDGSTKGTPKRVGPAASPTCAPVSKGLYCQRPKPRDVSVGLQSQLADLLFLSPNLEKSWTPNNITRHLYNFREVQVPHKIFLIRLQLLNNLLHRFLKMKQIKINFKNTFSQTCCRNLHFWFLIWIYLGTGQIEIGLFIYLFFINSDHQVTLRK